MSEDKPRTIKDMVSSDGWIYERGSRRRPNLDGGYRVKDFDLSYRSPDWLSSSVSGKTVRGMPCFRNWSYAKDLMQGALAPPIPEGSAAGGSNLKFKIDIDKVINNYDKYLRKNYDDNRKYKVKKKNAHGKNVMVKMIDPHYDYTKRIFKGANGLRFILEKINDDSSITDIRWAAYMLATTWHETTQTFLSRRENGGHDYPPFHAYFKAYPNLTSPVYYGRGYVQLTWHQNYKKFDSIIPGLYANPDLIIDDNNIAYKIMSVGMVQGWFTAHKLSDYINNSKCDYKGARRIINGSDRNILIAEVAQSFEKLLKDSSK